MSKEGIISAKIYIEHIFTQEMDDLRTQCFPPASPMPSSQDEFDSKSLHMTLRINGVIAAYVRLTPGPNAVFEKWTQGKAKIPTGKEVIDIGRVLVNPLYRGINLFEPICTSALIYANKAGFKYAVGAFRVGRKLITGGYKIGFESSGEPAYAIEPNNTTVLIQPTVCDLNKSKSLWPEIILSSSKQLKMKGYFLDSTILNQVFDQKEIFKDIGATAFYVIYYKNEGRKISHWRKRKLINGITTATEPYLFEDPHMEKLAINMPKAYIQLAQSRIKANPLFGPIHAIRQRYFNLTLSETIKNVANNAVQIIILGAGLDTRAVIEDKSNIKFFEIDLPHVMHAKKELFNNLQIAQNATSIPIDYTSDKLAEELARYDVDPTKSTHILWEGNIVYLTIGKVYKTIAKIKAYFKTSVTLSFDYHSEKAIKNEIKNANLESYINTVANTGPRFTTGIKDICHFASEIKADVIEDFTFKELIKLFGVDDKPDSVLDLFHCCTVKLHTEVE